MIVENSSCPKSIFVATVFKSGTKLIEYALAQMTGLIPYEPTEKPNYSEAEPIVFREGEFFIWHSVPSAEVKSKIRSSDIATIFLIRNIYDLVVSQYFHFANDVDSCVGHPTNTTEYFQKISQDEGLGIIICGVSSERFNWPGFGESLYQIQEMLKFSREFPCHLVVYERLLRNKIAELNRLANYLEASINPCLIDEIVDGSSFARMKEARITQYGCGAHFRKGIPGDHISVLKPHHYDMITNVRLKYAPELDALCSELSFGDILSTDSP